MKSRIKLIVVLLFLGWHLRAAATNIFVSSDQFLICVDIADLSFRDLIMQEGQGHIHFSPFEGRTPKKPIIWLKIEPEVLHGADHLYLSNYMDQIEVYYVNADGRYSIGGRLIDYDERSYQRGFYRNVVSIDPQRGTTYIKISSFHGFSIQNQSLSHIQAVSTDELEQHVTEIFTSSTLITGMEIIILIINLALWWLSRDRTVAFYIAVVASGMGMAILQNQTFIHFFDVSMYWVGWVEINLNFLLIYFFHAFSAHYLLAKEHSPKLHFVLTFPFFPIVLALAYMQDGVFFPIAATVYFLTSFAMIFVLIYRGWRQHTPRAVVYLIANSILIVLAIGLILALNEVVPHRFLTTNLPFLSFLIRDTIFTIDLIRNYINASKDAFERKLTIDKLTEEKEQMSHIQELKTRFFNNVSHELRTPLTLILSPLEQSIKSGKIPLELQRELNLSLKNGKYLLQLVNEMLDLGRLDKGELPTDRVKLEVVGLISGIRENFQAYAKERKQRLLITHGSNELMARLDRDKFEKIINNLISNAIKYSDEPGDVSIEIIENGRDLEIQVRDEGIGIEASEIPKIFDRYYQSRTIKSEGTGIGLSIVKEFTELHNGSVECTSVVGQGTKFVVRFPNALVKEEPSTDTLTSVRPIDSAKCTILLLEDNMDLRAYLKTKFPNYNLVAYQNGLEGLQAMQEGLLPDLIVTDYNMPKMNGFEFASSIKQHSKWASIPIIFLTARTLIKDKIEVFNLGVDDYMIKPFDLEELKVRVEKSLETSKKIREAAQIDPIYDDAVSSFKKKLDQYILANISNTHLDNIELSNHFSLSERNLYRKVKKASGQAPASYIREVRLQHARHLLIHKEELTVAEVAYQCGIDNVSNFTQLFKKRFGTTPSRIRINTTVETNRNATANHIRN
ncbi:MAG: ATP-binding protein [Cyclobacteriaceae bacterium]